jgi:hypothetical protein
MQSINIDVIRNIKDFRARVRSSVASLRQVEKRNLAKFDLLKNELRMLASEDIEYLKECSKNMKQDEKPVEEK